MILWLIACSAGTTEPAPAVDAPAHHGEAAADHHAPDDGHAAEQQVWTCSMHPDVRQEAPGSCPKCGMDLVLSADGEDAEAPADDHMGHMEEVRTGLQAALGDAYDQPIAGLDEADAEAGKAHYDTYCSACHGAGGKGDGVAAAALASKPADFTDAAHSSYYSDAGRLHILQNGIEGTPMGPFAAPLAASAQLDLYAYVKSLAGGEEPEGGGEHDHGAHEH